MEFSVTYWEDGDVVIRTSRKYAWDELPRGGVLRVETPDSFSQGHDHYWLEDDGSIGYADHHDYDASGWPVIGCELPDRHVINGMMIPDEEARELGLL